MFRPVMPQMVVSISEIVSLSLIVSVPQIIRVPQIVSISKIVSIPQIVCVSWIVSIPELRSAVSLVPRVRDSWISAIRQWRHTIALGDSCYRVWTGTCERTSTRIDRPPVPSGW